MKLGQLQQITDLRSVWKLEEKDFSTWLSKEQNLKLLSDELGINISLDDTEAKSGDFFIDLVATELETGRKIIIENQLEKTNHDHLGKIITYASGYEAQIIIWIVKEFRSEHKAAVDWLNENTDDKLNFFGIKIELWKIGNSEIAPKFNIVCQPNSWSKTIKSAIKKGEMSENALKQIKFFEEFISYCNTNKTSLKLGKPQPATPAYYSFGIGVGAAWVAIKMNRYKKLLKSDIYFTEKDLFNVVKEEYEALITKEIPEIKWDEMPNYKGATIGVELLNFNLDNENNWEQHYKILKEKTEQLVKVLKPLILKVRNGV